MMTFSGQSLLVSSLSIRCILLYSDVQRVECLADRTISSLFAYETGVSFHIGNIYEMLIAHQTMTLFTAEIRTRTT